MPGYLQITETGYLLLDGDGDMLILVGDGASGLIEIPNGRRPIAVNQPAGGGTNYPFVRPSEDVQYLLGDAYLSYEDPLCEFELPFKIGWMYGFGATAVSVPSGYPDPVHTHDLLILDANDEIVFDTTLATEFLNTTWPVVDPRLLILEWRTETEVLRVTQYVGWTAEDLADGIAREHDLYIVPENGELNPDVYERLPLRVRSITVGTEEFTAEKLVLESGFNVSVTEVQPEESLAEELTLDLAELGLTQANQLVTATRPTSRILLSAVPGSGLGVVPGCEDTDPIVREISGVRADSYGNVNLDAEGCIRMQRPVVLTSLEPRQFVHRRSGLTDTEAKSTFEIHNDCGQCCECDFFVRTYKGLARQWSLWQDMAEVAGGIRDQHALNKERWLAQKSCREENPFRLILIPEGECKAAVGVQFCNISQCCAVPLTMRFTFEFFRDGEPYTPAEPSCVDVEVDGSPQKNGPELAVWAGTWPVYEVSFDYADPQDISRASFRLCFNGCRSGDNLRMTVTAHYPELEDNSGGISCETPVATVSTTITDLWTASTLGDPEHTARKIGTTNLIPLDATTGACDQCVCLPE